MALCYLCGSSKKMTLLWTTFSVANNKYINIK
jgi:hypothetical protein